MKNLYFVQVGFEFDESLYLPYAVGTIIAYCKKNLPVDTEYDFKDIIFKREKISDVMNKLKDPYMVSFSCSVWNIEYNIALAKLIKETYPNCIIIFGGHNVSEDDVLLKNYSFIDFLMFGEGEVTTFNFLNALCNDDVSSVSNIAYRFDDEIINTAREYYYNLSEYPSPYTMGIFSEIMEGYKGISFLAILETNRGCPYNCAYCDWCAGRKVRHFPIEKVFSEIEWFGKNKIEYIFCADSNFGMFDKDVDIANKLVQTKKQYGYPQVFRPCYEKNSDERVFEICKLLNTENMDKGATFAYQTLCDEALENIGRKNLTLEHFSNLMKKYTNAGIPTYSELILGLPGETRESFCRGICRLFENGQHNSVSVYHCEILPNSDLADKDYMKTHKIESIRVSFNHIHSAPNKVEEVREYSYLVRSTATMSREDWVYSNLFSVCVQLFHSLGLLRHIAIYLHNEKIISYYDFYSKLLDYIFKNDFFVRDLFVSFEEKYEKSLEGDWNYYNSKFGHVTWFFEEGAFLEIITKLDEFKKSVYPFLKQFFDNEELLEELYCYNNSILRTPFTKRNTYSFNYDFVSYFENATLKNDYYPLQKGCIDLFINPQTSYDDVADYAKNVVWFGRRRGMTQISQRSEIEIRRK